MISHNVLPFAVVTLGFFDTAYPVDEGETIEICLSEINAELLREITVTVMSGGGTATGKYRAWGHMFMCCSYGHSVTLMASN